MIQYPLTDSAQSKRRTARYCSLAAAVGSRARQEDFAIAKIFDGVTIVVLADGIGGCADGDVASRTAVCAAWRVLHRNARHLARGRPESSVGIVWSALTSSSSAVLRLGNGPRAPGSTLIIGLLWHDRALFASVGDSAAYVDGRRITRGHNVGNALLAQIASLDAVELHIVELGRESSIVIASDGLDEQLAASSRIDAAAMVARQLHKGESYQDNVTVFASLERSTRTLIASGEVPSGEVPLTKVVPKFAPEPAPAGEARMYVLPESDGSVA
jgi:hypothetical protein